MEIFDAAVTAVREQSIFPFDAKPIALAQLAKANPRLQIIRQNLNEEIIALHDSVSG